jgi:hypothetical protein
MVPTGGTGWAKSSVNTSIFRTNSLVTFGNTQYVAFYDGTGRMILGKRDLDSTNWQLQVTPYSGDAKDAHNGISLGVDGKGILHIVWDLHNQELRYARTVAPGSLELTPTQRMTGDRETKVTYPQFYNVPNGDLFFIYREGSSGDGDVMLNRYDVMSEQWYAVHHPLIDGEGKRNAYVNRMGVDSKGGLHLSWVWRDTPDVATNHDVCYAYSPDMGITWMKSTGEEYQLPITAATAEVAWPVPYNSELINQTSATTDAQNRPVIATYWRDQGTDVPQYRVIWHDGEKWRMSQVGNRTQAFRLAGGGTKKIPISRPAVLTGKNNAIYIVFRDEERGNGVSVATSTDADHTQWDITDLITDPVGAWEPTYDPILWQRDGRLDLFLQRVGQGDAETLENIPPQDVSVLQWSPAR